MSKWIEVEVQVTRVYLVEVEDDDEDPSETALNLAIHEEFHGNFDEANISDPITDTVELERKKRHADTVISL